MWILIKYLVVLLVYQKTINAIKNTKFILKQEQLDVIYADKELVSFEGGVEDLNETTRAMKLNFNRFATFSDINVVNVVVNKEIKGKWRRFSAIQLTETFPVILKVKKFDLQSLFLEHANPQIVWPLTADQYVINDWVPDSDDFPSFLPIGRYKAEIYLYESKQKEKMIFHLDWTLLLTPFPKKGK